MAQPAFPFFQVSPGIITHCHAGVTDPAAGAGAILGPEDYVPDVPFVPHPGSGKAVTLTVKGWRQVRCDAAYAAPLPAPLPPPAFTRTFTCPLAPKLKTIDLLKQLQALVEADPMDFATDINAARQLLLVSMPSYKLSLASSIVPAVAMAA